MPFFRLDCSGQPDWLEHDPEVNAGFSEKITLKFSSSARVRFN